MQMTALLAQDLINNWISLTLILLVFFPENEMSSA